MLVLLLMTAPTQTTFSQTEWINNYKAHPMEEAMNPHIARPSRPDVTISVWETYVNEEWKLHAQMIDNEHGLPQWLDYNGVRVSLGEGNQRNPRAAYDSLGHVLITWEDDRSGSWSVYAQCLHVSDGSRHANWPQDGLPICDLAEDARHPRIAGIGDGAYIAWEDWRNSPPQSLNRDIYAVFVESQTASIPSGGGYQWQPDGVRVPYPLQQDADQRNVEPNMKNHREQEGQEGLFLETAPPGLRFASAVQAGNREYFFRGDFAGFMDVPANSPKPNSKLFVSSCLCAFVSEGKYCRLFSISFERNDIHEHFTGAS